MLTSLFKCDIKYASADTSSGVSGKNTRDVMSRFDSIVFARKARYRDVVFSGICLFGLVVVMSMLLALVTNLVIDGLVAIDWDFLSNFPSRRASRAGILSAWVGTLLVMLVTIALATPLGVATGLYLEEYAPQNWWTSLIEINITNLAGVPSIIYGILALGIFVYGLNMGETILVAGLVLALLIMPVIIVTTREAVRAVPQSLREAAYAMGADRWQMITLTVLPLSRPGILTGIIVGLSRAIGETAPVITIGALTFIAFLPSSPIQSQWPFVNFDWLTSPFTVMPIQMFNWTSRPQPSFHTLAAGTGLLLLFMTIAMNSVALWIRYRLRTNLSVDQ